MVLFRLFLWSQASFNLYFLVRKLILLKSWKQAGESSVIHLTGKDIDHEVLIQDIDLDPVTDNVRHADFYVIEKGKKVTVRVPLEFTGVAPAVKDLGGILVKVIHELEIEAMPKDLPHNLSVDISKLALLKTAFWQRTLFCRLVLHYSPNRMKSLYTISVSGPAAAASPRFAVDAQDALYSGLLLNTLFFYETQRDGSELHPQRAAHCARTPE